MAHSTSKLLVLPCFLFFAFTGAQTIPPKYQPKCTVAENQHCFSNESTACGVGQHVNNKYTNCTSRRPCCACTNGTFQPSRNFCDSCIECKDCSKKNQKVATPCNSTHDTVCVEELPEAVTTQSPETTQLSEDETITTVATAVTSPPSDQNDCEVCCKRVSLIFSHIFCLVVPFLVFIIYQYRSVIGSYLSDLWYTLMPGRSASLETGGVPRSRRRRRRRQSPSNRHGR